MSNPNNYKATDIERYLRGEMTAAEMHQLEKAALDDPMLADALEGYRSAGSISGDLEGQQARLQQRISKEKKARPVIWMQPWVRMAAVLLLVAGGGWLVWQTFSPPANDMAVRRPAENSKAVQENLPADSSATVLQQTPSPFAMDSTGRQDVALQRDKDAPRRFSAERKGTPIKATDEPQANETNQDAESLASERRQEITSMKATAPPTALLKADSAVADSQVAYSEKGEAATRQGVARMQANAATDSLAQPVGGWPAFEDYVAANRRPLLPLNKKHLQTDSVEIRFQVDGEGRPTNMVVTRSLDPQSDAGALRL